MLCTLAEVVRERAGREAKRWTNADELLASIHDLHSQTAWMDQHQRVWRERPKPLRRPWEPEKPQGMSGVSFIKAMAKAG